MKKFDISTPVKSTGLQKVKIHDKTHITLLNGKRIPTFLNMERKAAKI